MTLEVRRILTSANLCVVPQIRESEDEWGVPNAFTLIGQQQSVVVAAR